MVIGLVVQHRIVFQGFDRNFFVIVKNVDTSDHRRINDIFIKQLAHFGAK